MQRELETIQTKERLNDHIYAGPQTTGNASHEYVIARTIEGNINEIARIHFQEGPRNEETSITGVLDVDLLEIVRDRMKGFQSGDFASEYNTEALEHIESALESLNKRVEDRIERGVLGTNNI